MQVSNSSKRLGCLDAYRGFLMLMLVAGAASSFHEGFGVSRVLENIGSNQAWAMIAHQLRHVPWEGGVFWDFLMPSFMLVVGIGMAYSYANRKQKGQADSQIAKHIAVRSVGMVVLGSVGLTLLENLLNREKLLPVHFGYINVLCQIGLATPFVFILLKQELKYQILVSSGILTLYWVLFAVWPVSELGNTWEVADLAHGARSSGFFVHWNPNENFAADLQRSIVSLLHISDKRDAWIDIPAVNFIPSIVTIVIGVMVGNISRGQCAWRDKLKRLALGGAICLVSGILLGLTICPIVKSVWTPSWVLYAAGWSIVMFLPFIWLMEIRENRVWAFPFVVMGKNALVAYIIANVADYPILRVWERVLGKGIFLGSFGPAWEGVALIATVWVATFELNRRGFTIRI